MDCLSFRRRILENPFDHESALMEHERACPACAEFARQTRNRDHALRRLLEVEPPPGMTERIQMAISFDQHQQRQHSRPWWVSAVAGLLIAVAAVTLSVILDPLDRRNVALAESVVNHIKDEAHHLREAGPVDRGAVKLVFRRFGADLIGDIGRVNFAAMCLMRKKTGVHLVLPGEHGPITVFYMPDEMTDEVIEVSDERFQGQVVPTAWGSVAIVGERGEDLGDLAQRLVAAVRWPAARLGARSGDAPEAPFELRSSVDTAPI